MKKQKYHMNCPYCGAPAICRPSSMVHGGNTWQNDTFLYVCSRWPECDSYVTAHKYSLIPMGSMANKSLRSKRMQAHRAMDELRRCRHMDTWAVYVWIQMKMDLPPDKAHIGMFSEEMCDRLISICRASLRTERIQAA